MASQPFRVVFGDKADSVFNEQSTMMQPSSELHGFVETSSCISLPMSKIKTSFLTSGQENAKHSAFPSNRHASNSQCSRMILQDKTNQAAQSKCSTLPTNTNVKTIIISSAQKDVLHSTFSTTSNPQAVPHSQPIQRIILQNKTTQAAVANKRCIQLQPEVLNSLVKTNGSFPMSKIKTSLFSSGLKNAACSGVLSNFQASNSQPFRLVLQDKAVQSECNTIPTNSKVKTVIISSAQKHALGTTTLSTTSNPQPAPNSQPIRHFILQGKVNQAIVQNGHSLVNSLGQRNFHSQPNEQIVTGKTCATVVQSPYSSESNHIFQTAAGCTLSQIVTSSPESISLCKLRNSPDETLKEFRNLCTEYVKKSKIITSIDSDDNLDNDVFQTPKQIAEECFDADNHHSRKINKENLSHNEKSKESNNETDEELDSDVFKTPKQKAKKRCLTSHSERPDTLGSEERKSELSDANFNKILKRMLPLEYDHVNISIEPLAKEGTFKAQFRVNLRSKVEALTWLEIFKASSLLEYTVDKTFTENSQRVIFKKRFKCYCNTGASRNSSATKQAHRKHTNCEAQLQITVKNFNMKWSEDKLLKSHPCEITLHHRHNHPIQSSHALRHRKPSLEVEKKFIALFERGHSPSSALREHRYDLQNDHKADFILYDGDGAHRPNLQWAYYQYYKTFKSSYGDADGEGMIKSLESAVCKYNEESGSICAKMCTENSDIVVAICWPMMKRIHSSLSASGEIAFVDIGGGMDRHNTRVLLMMTPSVAGALPLGILLMSCESQDVITKGLDLLQSLFPQDAFNGRGQKGPKIFLTDDSASERNSLQSVYKDAVLLLCVFHILQAFWRYVVDSKHGVLNWQDKGYIFNKFHNLLYSQSEEEFESSLNDILKDEVFRKYKKIIDHLVNDMLPRAREWALCYRSLLMTRGNNTNNFVESAFRVLKDIVMQRCRAYSLVQLFHFMISNFPAYIERRLSAVINNRLDSYWQSRFFIPLAKLEPLTCSFLNGTCYLVCNSISKGEYIVDTKSWLCSCYVGKNGASCKHQFIVAKQFNLSTDQFLPEADGDVKRVLYYIMTGSVDNLPLEWFKTLNSGAGEDTLPQENCDNASDAVPCGSSGVAGLCSNNAEEADSLHAGLSLSGNAAHPNYSARLAECSDQLDMFAKKMKELMFQKPDVFVPAVEKFCEGFCHISGASLNSLSSALHCCFKDITDKRLIRGREILANRESVRRRASRLGGRKIMQSGRPPCNAAKRLLSAAKRKAPHNLPQVVRMKCPKLS